MVYSNPDHHHHSSSSTSTSSLDNRIINVNNVSTHDIQHQIIRERSKSMQQEKNEMVYPIVERHIGVRERSVSWTSENPYTAIGWVSFWYFFSTAATFLNKIFIKKYGVRAETLSIFHLIVSNVMDFALLKVPEKSRVKIWYYRPITSSAFLRILPLSVLAIFAKLLTYWSYNAVPISITHTAKASTPFFNVLVSWFVYSKRFNTKVYVSLVPIAIGVAIASISEVQINNLALNGVCCAVLSSFVGVIQNMYAKNLLRHGIISDSVNLHFYNGVMQMLVNLPILFFSSGGSKRSIFSGAPMSLVFLCSFMQFLGSLAAMMLLGKVTELTYSILSTLKRVVVIINSVLYFGNPITFQSLTGMSLAVGGVGYYQYVKIHDPRHQIHVDHQNKNVQEQKNHSNSHEYPV